MPWRFETDDYDREQEYYDIVQEEYEREHDYDDQEYVGDEEYSEENMPASPWDNLEADEFLTRYVTEHEYEETDEGEDESIIVEVDLSDEPIDGPF